MLSWRVIRNYCEGDWVSEDRRLQNRDYSLFRVLTLCPAVAEDHVRGHALCRPRILAECFFDSHLLHSTDTVQLRTSIFVLLAVHDDG